MPADPTLTHRHEDGHDIPLLVWRLPTPARAISSAVLGGGLGECHWVINATVPMSYARNDPESHLADLGNALGLAGPGIGLLTGVDVADLVTELDDGIRLWATVGLSAPIQAHDPAARVPGRDPAAQVASSGPAASASPGGSSAASVAGSDSAESVAGPSSAASAASPGPSSAVSAASPGPSSAVSAAGPHSAASAAGPHSAASAAGPHSAAATVTPHHPGTINIVGWLPRRLSDAALVNAVATITEAKTQAIRDLGLPATGTATDAVCVLCPPTGDPASYGGPRSRWGEPLARAAYRAVLAGGRANLAGPRSWSERSGG
ncbi:adenosylcobinamide amidohydrolase [Actinoplanes subtropicus]|uniref:adenosylcobinamide amidohydrolase n=1 Tax=Actinoplanes subtropicus TaxID=543632 RepID=UPI00055155DB|nr:adenosylcobinamide amidohydrolase [Actinoplanes subtropicus]